MKKINTDIFIDKAKKFTEINMTIAKWSIKEFSSQ